MTIDPRLLDECYRIWKLREFRGLPPDPYEVLNMSTAIYQVFAYAQIVKFVQDEKKRREVGGV